MADECDGKIAQKRAWMRELKLQRVEDLYNPDAEL